MFAGKQECMNNDVQDFYVLQALPSGSNFNCFNVIYDASQFQPKEPTSRGGMQPLFHKTIVKVTPKTQESGFDESSHVDASNIPPPSITSTSFNKNFDSLFANDVANSEFTRSLQESSVRFTFPNTISMDMKKSLEKLEDHDGEIPGSVRQQELTEINWDRPWNYGAIKIGRNKQCLIDMMRVREIENRIDSFEIKFPGSKLFARHLMLPFYSWRVTNSNIQMINQLTCFASLSSQHQKNVHKSLSSLLQINKNKNKNVMDILGSGKKRKRTKSVYSPLPKSSKRFKGTTTIDHDSCIMCTEKGTFHTNICQLLHQSNQEHQTTHDGSDNITNSSSFDSYENGDCDGDEEEEESDGFIDFTDSGSDDDCGNGDDNHKTNVQMQMLKKSMFLNDSDDTTDSCTYLPICIKQCYCEDCQKEKGTQQLAHYNHQGKYCASQVRCVRFMKNSANHMKRKEGKGSRLRLRREHGEKQASKKGVPLIPIQCTYAQLMPLAQYDLLDFQNKMLHYREMKIATPVVEGLILIGNQHHSETMKTMTVSPQSHLQKKQKQQQQQQFNHNVPNLLNNEIPFSLPKPLPMVEEGTLVKKQKRKRNHFNENEPFKFSASNYYKLPNDYATLTELCDYKAVLKIALQMMTSLAYLHDLGFAHLDMKAENLLLKKVTKQQTPTTTITKKNKDSVSSEWLLMICDFGSVVPLDVATGKTSISLELFRTIMTTPEFLSPELLGLFRTGVARAPRMKSYYKLKTMSHKEPARHFSSSYSSDTIKQKKQPSSQFSKKSSIIEECNVKSDADRLKHNTDCSYLHGVWRCSCEKYMQSIDLRKCDVYSAGVVLYGLIFHCTPDPWDKSKKSDDKYLGGRMLSHAADIIADCDRNSSGIFHPKYAVALEAWLAKTEVIFSFIRPFVYLIRAMTIPNPKYRISSDQCCEYWKLHLANLTNSRQWMFH